MLRVPFACPVAVAEMPFTTCPERVSVTTGVSPREYPLPVPVTVEITPPLGVREKYGVLPPPTATTEIFVMEPAEGVNVKGAVDPALVALIVWFGVEPAVPLTVAVWVLSARTGEEGRTMASSTNGTTALKKVDAQGEVCNFMGTVG